MQFYVLRKEIGCQTDTEFERVEPIVRGDPLRCPACGEFCTLKQWRPPYRVRVQRHGSVLGDVIFDAGDDFLVSQSFVTAWNKRGLKGLEPLHPVEVVSIRPRSLRKNLQPYYRPALQATGPRIDRERSVLSGDEPDCLRCGGSAITNAILALRIDEASWSGEDIFIPWGTVDTIVTQRVVDLARDHGLTNVTTIPIEEFRWDPLRLQDQVPTV